MLISGLLHKSLPNKLCFGDWTRSLNFRAITVKSMPYCFFFLVLDSEIMNIYKVAIPTHLYMTGSIRDVFFHGSDKKIVGYPRIITVTNSFMWTVGWWYFFFCDCDGRWYRSRLNMDNCSKQRIIFEDGNKWKRFLLSKFELRLHLMWHTKLTN